MTTALATRRDYLVPQRRVIISRAIIGSLTSMIPVPFVDDWVMGAVLGSGYKRIAASHNVDIDDDAVKSLVFGASQPTKVADLAVSGIVVKIAGRAAKRMLLALATINRARAASRHFLVMTLFDHYCAKLHVGGALDNATALALRGEIGKAIDNTPGALAFHPFRRGALAAAKATLRAPLELADLASGGAIRRLVAARRPEVTEGEAVNEVDRAVETELANQGGFLARTVVAVETQLSSEHNPFLDAAIDNLDRRWRARMAAETK